MDIHSAIKRTGTLPEDELRNLVEEYKQDNDIDSFFDKVDRQVLAKLNLFLNKSIVEVTRLGKNEKVLKGNKHFWQKIEDELLHRVTSLTNEQITDVLCNFGKSEVSGVNIFDDYEDVIMESEIPFLVIF
jgi:hypothetical protein